MTGRRFTVTERERLTWDVTVGCEICGKSQKVTLPDGFDWILNLALFLLPGAPPLDGPCVRRGDGQVTGKPHVVRVLHKAMHVAMRGADEGDFDE